MNTYTRDQIREAMYAMFTHDNEGRRGFTPEQYTALGMVMSALTDYDKTHTQPTARRTVPAGETATPQ